jgi:hypothetical protein
VVTGVMLSDGNCWAERPQISRSRRVRHRRLRPGLERRLDESGR